MSTEKASTNKVSEGCAAPARRRLGQLQSARPADVPGGGGLVSLHRPLFQTDDDLGSKRFSTSTPSRRKSALGGLTFDTRQTIRRRYVRRTPGSIDISGAT
jgi:hypothetical protein